MSAQSQLEAYLSEFRHRLKVLIVARGAALAAFAALAITLAAVYFGTRRAFDPGFMVSARMVLVLILAAIAVSLVIYPLRLLRRGRGIRDLEQRAPDFDGRLETYDGLTHPKEPAQPGSPFLVLLAEDAMRFARRIPIALKIPSWQISVPAVLAGIAVVGLVWFAAFGPDNWRYGVRHLWAGWLVSDTLPPQRIAVEPGDLTVRRGGDLPINARAEGFDPAQMEVFALFEGGANWQRAQMTRDRDRGGFDFTFFALREPLRYYISAAGLRSPEYRVQVVDLPRVTNIRLQYEYPEWTGLEPRTVDPGNDIRAVEGTEVLVEVHTDQPLADPELVANNERITMSSEGNVSTARLQVTESGEYHIATLFNRDPVRVTDDYFISLVADQKPDVRVVKPGRDWRATSIEEVTVSVEATDDFGLESLELRYSINGSEWQTARLDADGDRVLAEHVLYLEDLRAPLRRPRARSAEQTRRFPLRSGEEIRSLDDLRRLREAGEQQESVAEVVEEEATDRALRPGDLISYYVVATDRAQEVQTDLFFVDVQPFDRSFTQSMQSGGGGGGGGQEDEISQRQREILVATWNLIRERSEEDSFLDQQQFRDNALMLAELQRTLADQARTLANRTRARQLTQADERISVFVENLEEAAEVMIPASEHLAELDLNDAVPFEQEALQYLLRAESVFTDIQVAMQRGGGGGGGMAGRDLSELFELEMDLERNQYETEAPVAFDQPEDAVDEAIAKLQELARRQERLAREANRRNNLTDQERWQQEMLRRETEELRRQLEQLQQQMAEAQQQGEQGQEGQEGQEGQQGQQGGQPGQQGGQLAQAGGQRGQMGEAIQQIQDALDAMDRAGADADPEQAQRAIEQARRQLDRALAQMTEQRQALAEAAFSDLADRSRELYAEQRELAAELQAQLRAGNDGSQDRSRLRGGLDLETAVELAERRRELQRELEALEQDLQRVSQEFRRRTPRASEELSDALANLQQSQAIARLNFAADAIRSGAAPQVAATEAVTTSALRDLQRDTERALATATREAVEGQTEIDPNAELLAEIGMLRRELAELSRARDGEQPGAQAGGQQNGGDQPGGDQPGGDQPGGDQPGGDQPGGGGELAGGGGADRGGAWGGRGGYYDPRERGWGQFGPYDPRVWDDPQRVSEARDRLAEAGADLLRLGNQLRDQGLTEEQLRYVRELGDALRGGFRGNPELLASEFRALVDLADQLELQLRADSARSGRAVRTEAPTQVAQGYEEAVAEYFRRLGSSTP